MLRRHVGRWMWVVLLAAAVGCALPVYVGGAPTDRSAPTSTYALATPYAESPAAGICAKPEAIEVEMSLLPGIPDPRCLQVRPDQQLTVHNGTGGPVDVRLGPYSAHLEDGGDFTIEAPFAAYLAPGVHGLQVDPCCGGEIVLPAD
jgi:hypothetical protein